MKNVISTCVSLLLFLSISLFVACNKDDENGPSYEFKDQNLQGKIDGIAFSFNDGTVEDSFFEDNRYAIELFDETETEDACDVFFQNSVNVFFEAPSEVGVYELFLDLKNFTGQTVTLYNPEGAFNNIAVDGAIEILTVSETGVTGRMDTRINNQNFLNGNFSAVFCAQ